MFDGRSFVMNYFWFEIIQDTRIEDLHAEHTQQKTRQSSLWMKYKHLHLSHPYLPSPPPVKTTLQIFNLYLHHIQTTPQPTIKMKFAATTIATLIAALPMANAWIFSTTAGQWDGENNRSCTKASSNAGEIIDWENEWGSDCTLRVYSDSKCRRQIGNASDDWNDHQLSTSMGSFKVSSCSKNYGYSRVLVERMGIGFLTCL